MRKALFLSLMTSLLLISPGWAVTVSSEGPRGGDVEVAGRPWLARMIDKAQLDAEGRMPAGHQYGCCRDKAMLKELGLSKKAFQTMVVAAKDDAEVVVRLGKRLNKPVRRACCKGQGASTSREACPAMEGSRQP
jgi:hypothetical protein